MEKILPQVVIEYKQKTKEQSKQTSWIQIMLLKTIPPTNDTRPLLIVHKNFTLVDKLKMVHTFLEPITKDNRIENLNNLSICQKGDLMDYLPSDVSKSTKLFVNQNIGECNLCRNIGLYDFLVFCGQETIFRNYLIELEESIKNYINMYFDGDIKDLEFRILFVANKRY